MKVEVIRLRTSFIAAAALAEFQSQAVDDTAGNLVLNSNDIRQFAVIFSRPQWKVVADANQLGVDAQLLAREQDRTFENVFGVKLLSNVMHILRLAFQSERGCLR